MINIGVLGAGAWAKFAHLPGYRRDARCRVVAIADPQIELAREAAALFDIPVAVADHRAVIERDDIHAIDVCTPSATHFELTWAALEAGKHVLCEKPVAYDYRDTLRARDLARSKGLRTKVGFTFRFSPAMRYAQHLIDSGYVGTPFIFNGYEQNSQWLDPAVPLRQVRVDADPAVIQVSSLEGYGAPIIDLAHRFVGADLASVVGTMRNFIPERMVRATGRRMRMNIDDGDIFLGEFVNGALCSIQTSFVTVGNYPGIEARIYGSEGALICRLVEEKGICETLKGARPNHVEFEDLPVPDAFYPPGGSAKESWRTLFYANLITSWVDEMLDPSRPGEGDFTDGAWVQEVINAVEVSFRTRAWTSLGVRSGSGLISVSAIAPRPIAETEISPDPDLTTFLQHYYRRRPVNATFTGVHDFDDQLPDWSPDGLDALAAEMAALQPDQDDDLVASFLEIQRAEVEGAHFQRRNPALFTGEALFGLIALVTRDFAPATERVEALRGRLARVPRFLAAAMQTVSHPVPESWRARAVRECRAAETFLAGGLPRYLHQHGVARDGDEDRLREAATAFARLRDWLERDARVAVDDEPAPCGEPFFTLLLRRGHYTTESVDSLRDRAQAELDDEIAALDRAARALDPDGWPAIQARLAADHPGVDDYVATFEREWVACRDAAVAADLVTWPEWPLRYVPIPSHTRDVAPQLYYLFYRSPAPFDPHVTPESLVTPIEASMPEAERLPRLRAMNRSVIRLNHVIHHGALGHHVQNHAAYRAPSIVGRIAGVDCASRIAMFSAGTMAEGWACYAVDLMEEIGYLTPEERVSQAHTRVRQLARALIDIGLHVDGWSLARAIAFWQQTVGAPLDAARGEVTRTSMFPGTAIMYWLGTQMIHGLRRQWCARHTGPDRLRRFHDSLLAEGSIPVALRGRRMLEELS